MPAPSALVLGGSGGIGAAVSRRLAEAHAVAIGYHRDRERAEALSTELAETGATVETVQADAATEDGVLACFDAAQKLGELRVVVNCVGGWDYPKIAERVVMLSSAAADVAPARQSTYAAAKAGLEAASRVAAKELAGRGVTVNVIRPGATDTRYLRNVTSPRAIEAMAGANAMRRLGTPEDIAGAVMLLCADDAAWVTGAVLDATGGLR